MTDVQKALAAARELHHDPEVTYSAYWFAEYQSRMGDLLAALDAQRPVALPEPAFRLTWGNDGKYRVNKPHIGDTDCYTAEQVRAILAAAPAPAVPEHIRRIRIPTETMEQEFQNHYRRGFEAGKKQSRIEMGVALASQAPPAAVVPSGYAAAIKAVQEMMPPRDFRPSAQVWLTGNQVNELHARLDAAAALAAAQGVGRDQSNSNP